MSKYKNKLKILLFIILQSILSYILLSYYSGGDSVPYNKFYNEINNSSLFSSFSIAQYTITGIEPIPIIIFWIFSNLGVKKIFCSIVLNVILAIGILKITEKYKIPNYIAFLLFTNFYLIVLFTAAERLKISYIFIIWGFLLCSRYRNLFYILSIFSHFQNIFLFFSIFFSKIITFKKKKLYIKLEDFFFLFGLIIFLLLLIINLNYILYDLNIIKYIKSKAEYIGVYPISSVYKLLFLNILIYFVISKKLIRTQILFLFFYIFILTFGPHRINMIAITAVLGLLITEKKIKHPLVILLLLYFSFSSIPLIISILTSNHGFEYLLWFQ